MFDSDPAGHDTPILLINRSIKLRSRLAQPGLKFVRTTQFMRIFAAHTVGENPPG